ncbi:adenylate/guanylate cyclase domain-containing protein [uncultured Allomuricauda sp.]|uniref:adenylate/guanylate cyclase domain-containing protein n=1 Tax=Flagellimonas sp. W118 TaxID=3410791 RepID=UPI0026102ACE|nr:adenylate/guanylate cyclase domain-containing protein [uncultured Allomuricauda sp.]
MARVKELNTIKSYLIGWLIASLLWRLFRDTDLSTERFTQLFTLESFFIFIALWLTMGLLFGLIHIAMTKFVVGRVKYYQLVLFRIFLQLTVFIGIMIALINLLRVLLDVEFPDSTWGILNSLSLFVACIYILIINFCIGFVMYISSIVGKENLKKILSGKFYTPLVTEKVFMFIDLRGSTQLAERLGHIAYSKLIQDCFSDLVVVHNYHAEIYQYVGDEAVLTWDVDNAVRLNNGIKAFFAFQKRLHDRSEHYLSTYGAVPDFKAGMHGGVISMTEVGELKRDIAYHGDTINTAARLQGECNRLNVNLLISESLLGSLDLKKEFKSTLMGKMQLRGKNAAINVYSLEEAAK